MIDPREKKQFNRLKHAVERSRRKLEPFRTHRQNFINEYVGRNYSNSGAMDKVPVPLIELYVDIVSRSLVAQQPQVMISTQHRKLKPQAADFELALNHLLREINFAETMQRVVVDAIFSMGIIKCGLTAGNMHEMDGILHDAGQPYADVVDLGDWVHDMGATSWEQCQYMGNRYRLPLDAVMELYGDKAEGLQPSIDPKVNEQGDPRTKTVQSGESQEHDDPQDWVELWDIWLPRERLVVTYPYQMEGRQPLRVMEWDGPEQGPYHILGFKTVPGSTLPLSPIASTYDLHTAVNGIFRKIIRMSENYKKIPWVRKGEERDAIAIQEANNMDWAVVENPEGIGGELVFNEHSPNQMALGLMMRDMFSWFSGNLDSLGGLSPQADTLGAEELLAASSSQKIEAMQRKVIGFTEKVVNAMAWYMVNDPTYERTLSRQIGHPSLNLYVPSKFSPNDLEENSYFEFNYEINPHSMRHQTPASQLQTILAALERVYLPFREEAMAQGRTVDFDALAEMFASLSNTPAVKDVLTVSTMNREEERGPLAAGGKSSPHTEHKSVRVNRPGATRAGSDKVIAAAALGADSQPDEMAAAFRPNT